MSEKEITMELSVASISFSLVKIAGILEEIETALVRIAKAGEGATDMLAHIASNTENR